MITKIMSLRISGFWTFRNEEEPLHFDVHVWDLNTEVSKQSPGIFEKVWGAYYLRLIICASLSVPFLRRQCE